MKTITNNILCATTITTIDYLCTKAIGRKPARQAISDLLALFSIADVNRKTLVAAIESDFSDFEAHAHGNETKNYKNLAIEDIKNDDFNHS